MTDTPDGSDIGAWRALIHAATDRAAAAAVVRQWAGLLGCTFGEGEDDGHLIHPPPSGLPGPLAGALAYHATSTCLHLRPPPGGWPRSDRLPEWVPGT